MNYKKLILPGILLLITAGVYFYEPSAQKKNKKFTTLPNHKTTRGKTTSSVSFLLAQDLTKQSALIQEGLAFLTTHTATRDPFVKVEPPKPKPKPKTRRRRKQKPPPVKLVLQGILQSEGQKVAFINGKTLALNDTIAGYQLIKIQTSQVVLVKKGKKRILKLKK